MRTPHRPSRLALAGVLIAGIGAAGWRLAASAQGVVAPPRAVVAAGRTTATLADGFSQARAPLPLSRAELLTALKGLAAPATPGSSQPVVFTLSPKQPYVEGKGWVAANYPQAFTPSKGLIALNATATPRTPDHYPTLFVQLYNLKPNSRYLLDFSVYYAKPSATVEPNAAFVYLGGDTPQTVGAAGGAQHLLFVMQTGSWTEALLPLKMQGSESWWCFYQVDITPI